MKEWFVTSTVKEYSLKKDCRVTNTAGDQKNLLVTAVFTLSFPLEVYSSLAANRKLLSPLLC